jgi:DNA-binding transcriptional ArsR family regulator
MAVMEPAHATGSRGAGGEVDLAAVGSLLAEPARARILQALFDGRALPAGMLAAEAGVAASTASAHLARLVDGGLLGVEHHGRHRYYQLADERVAATLENLAALAPITPIRSLRDDTRARALRRARTCYDHLAGELGVALMTACLGKGLLAGHDGSFRPGIERLSAPGGADCYHLTAPGRDFFAALGLELQNGPHRALVRHCVDWSEQRHHLSGRLGAELASLMFRAGWVERTEVRRAIRLTSLGARELSARFDLDTSKYG